jgi:lipid-A-disaccharide synthase
MIVVYRTTWPTYWIGRALIRVKWIGMVNLVGNRTICPEFIQHEAKPAAMADVMQSLIEDSPARQAQLGGLWEVASALEGAGRVTPAGQVVADSLG